MRPGLWPSILRGPRYARAPQDDGANVERGIDHARTARAAAGRPHRLPLLRGRLRRAGAAGRPGRRNHHRRSRSSGELRPAVLQGLRAGGDAGPQRPPARSACCGEPTAAYTRVDWDTALSGVADGFRRVVERDGPDAVAFYLSGQLLTEDYYVANKLMKGFLGSANVDTNSRLCMASTVAGHRRAFGEDVVPGSYEDLDQANLLVLVGSNTAWCHPVLFQRMTRNRRERGAKIVVIDPRRTATGDEADLFLAIAPGTDTALFCGPAGASRRCRRARPDLYRSAHVRLRRGARARAGDRARHRRDRRRDRPRRRRRRALLPAVPRQAKRSSPASRRASTSRRRAPTRSTPSSTAISPPAASAGPAWGRSR